LAMVGEMSVKRGIKAVKKEGEKLGWFMFG
jgi:hypothetical protein